jgi:hypothetical protein
VEPFCHPNLLSDVFNTDADTAPRLMWVSRVVAAAPYLEEL